MKILRKIAIIALFFAFNHSLQAQFKFSWGLLGLNVSMNPEYNKIFPTLGFNGYFEFGALIEDHFEPGVRTGGMIFFDATKGVSLNGHIMPYLRYYFLERQDVRPFVLGSVGLVGNAAGGVDVSNTNFSVGGGYFVGARIGGGVRLAKFIEFGMNYFYGGRFESINLLAIQAPVQWNHLHTLEFSFALAFGGNLKPKDKIGIDNRAGKYGKGSYY